jgi:hypothetical protein
MVMVVVGGYYGGGDIIRDIFFISYVLYTDTTSRL